MWEFAEFARDFLGDNLVSLKTNEVADAVVLYGLQIWAEP